MTKVPSGIVTFRVLSCDEFLPIFRDRKTARASRMTPASTILLSVKLLGEQNDVQSRTRLV